MAVHVAHCRMCHRCFSPARRSFAHGARALLISMPVIAGGAAAAWWRPDYLLLSGLGLGVWAMATYLLREPCPHCHSPRTRHRRIPYLTIVR